MQRKQMLIIGAVVVLLIIIGGVVIAKKLMKPSATQTATTATVKHHITDPVNVIDQNQRPYMEIKPLDVHNIGITVDQVKLPATSVDYELEYQTDTSLEGLTGTLSLSTVPTQTQPLLLGTCSAGGACTYNTDVQGGTLLAKFSGGATAYTVKQDWAYYTNSNGGTQFSSRDAFFQIDSKDLANQGIIIIYNTPGYPQTPTGTVISEAYDLNTVSPMTGTATLTMRAKDDATGAVIDGWNGQSWKEYTGTVNGKSITAQVDLLPVYVMVKK